MMLENVLVKSIAGAFTRCPTQLNGLNESDAELIPSEILRGEVLALKVDGLSDEIQAGLYENPYVIGWTAVNATLSDLAAVGAEPIGMMLLLQLPPDYPELARMEICRGIREACAFHNTFLLGGDTNHGKVLDVAMMALGRTSRPVMRKGCAPGDSLFCSGPMGYGNAYAFAKLFLGNTLPYHPIARLKEGLLIRDYASSCIDSSDGFFPALAQLTEVNSLGFSLEKPLSECIEPTAMSICSTHSIPPWLMLAGPHGEYELVFTVNEAKVPGFLEASRSAELNFLWLGECRENPALSFDPGFGKIDIHPADIANLYEENATNPQAYFHKLQMLHQSWLPKQ